jgi:AmmeMemoRadiSam system protein B
MADVRPFTAEYPKLRPLDIRPYAHDGQPYFILRDPLHLSDRQLLLPQAFALLLFLCDGSRSAQGIASALSHYYSATVPDEFVGQVVAALDEACLLDNARAAAAQRRALESYRQAPYRPPLLAGQSYPADPDELEALLEGYLAAARRSRNGAHHLASPPIAGLLSPHIDYPRGGPVYAQVWDQAAPAVRNADLVILIGTDHYGGEPFTLTRQSYATPYGMLPTATHVVDRLAGVLGEEAAFAGELRHRHEHSLELVAVWLHHLRGRRPVELVPILAGGFRPYLDADSSPAGDDRLRLVLAALAEATAGRNVLVVASGDLAHVGPAFGGEPLDEAARTSVAAADAELLQRMRGGDAEGFFAAIRAVGDRYNVCGVAPIYLTLRLLGEVSGEPAGYATCLADGQGASAVTVGGMVFRR